MFDADGGGSIGFRELHRMVNPSKAEKPVAAVTSAALAKAAATKLKGKLQVRAQCRSPSHVHCTFAIYAWRKSCKMD